MDLVKMGVEVDYTEDGHLKFPLAMYLVGNKLAEMFGAKGRKVPHQIGDLWICPCCANLVLLNLARPTYPRPVPSAEPLRPGP